MPEGCFACEGGVYIYEAEKPSDTGQVITATSLLKDWFVCLIIHI